MLFASAPLEQVYSSRGRESSISVAWRVLVNTPSGTCIVPATSLRLRSDLDGSKPEYLARWPMDCAELLPAHAVRICPNCFRVCCRSSRYRLESGFKLHYTKSKRRQHVNYLTILFLCCKLRVDYASQHLKADSWKVSPTWNSTDAKKKNHLELPEKTYVALFIYLVSRQQPI